MKPQERIAAIFGAPSFDAQAIVVAIAIASHLSDDDDGWCWPSVSRLMAMTKLGERTIQRVIRWGAAPEIGWLYIDDRFGQMRKLRIDWGRLSAELPSRETGAMQGTTPRRSGTPVGATPPSERREPPSERRQTPVGAAPEPTSEPTKEPTTPPTRAGAGATGDSTVTTAPVVVDGVTLPGDLPALLEGDHRSLTALTRAGIRSTAELVAVVRLDPRGWFKSGVGAPVGVLVDEVFRRAGLNLAVSAQGPPSRASPRRSVAALLAEEAAANANRPRPDAINVPFSEVP